MLITFDNMYVNITQKRLDLDSAILEINVRRLQEDGRTAVSAVQQIEYVCHSVMTPICMDLRCSKAAD